MDTHLNMPTCRGSLQAGLQGLAELLPLRAAALDEAGAFPREDILGLHEAGALLAPFPVHAGGIGLGTEPAGAGDLAECLRLLGRGNLSVGRLFEAHVNAIKLLALYGDEAQIARAAEAARAGQLFGLWVTDGADDPLRADEHGVLHGRKAVCSGAGYVNRAVVTVQCPDGLIRLAYLEAPKPAGMGQRVRLQGMRAACTGSVSFEGCGIAPHDYIGAPGDYLREPHFSAGAWRTSAVTWGGLEALVEAAMRHLVGRRRETSPHQQARMGQAWIAQETAGSWVLRAARLAEAADAVANAEEVVATVNLARIAIETACLQASTLVERSVGIAAFQPPGPIERIRRDLATYLRQPAADEVLTEAAAYIMRSRMGGT